MPRSRSHVCWELSRPWREPQAGPPQATSSFSTFTAVQAELFSPYSFHNPTDRSKNEYSSAFFIRYYSNLPPDPPRAHPKRSRRVESPKQSRNSTITVDSYVWLPRDINSWVIGIILDSPACVPISDRDYGTYCESSTYAIISSGINRKAYKNLLVFPSNFPAQDLGDVAANVS